MDYPHHASPEHSDWNIGLILKSRNSEITVLFTTCKTCTDPEPSLGVDVGSNALIDVVQLGDRDVLLRLVGCIEMVGNGGLIRAV